MIAGSAASRGLRLNCGSVKARPSITHQDSPPTSSPSPSSFSPLRRVCACFLLILACPVEFLSLPAAEEAATGAAWA